MSVCLPFTKDCEQRAVPRGLYNIIGCAVFLVLYFLLPESMYPYIGMIGGIGVGYSASYPWQTVFNTFGALYIAENLFGLKNAIILRIAANVFGSLYAYGFDQLFRKITTSIRNLFENNSIMTDQA